MSQNNRFNWLPERIQSEASEYLEIHNKLTGSGTHHMAFSIKLRDAKNERKENEVTYENWQNLLQYSWNNVPRLRREVIEALFAFPEGEGMRLEITPEIIILFVGDFIRVHDKKKDKNGNLLYVLTEEFRDSIKTCGLEAILLSNQKEAKNG